MIIATLMDSIEPRHLKYHCHQCASSNFSDLEKWLCQNVTLKGLDEQNKPLKGFIRFTVKFSNPQKVPTTNSNPL